MFPKQNRCPLADILPDWAGDDRIRLLTRPIFDPATLGRARFHTDNDGTVRSFLSARWLVRLRAANLSTASLFRLLFANSYGLEVIKPSLNDTVAWLCVWDKDVANEVIRRGPGLLLRAGDPASLSVGVRSAALAALLSEATAEDQEWPWWDNDKLRRCGRKFYSTLGRRLDGFMRSSNGLRRRVPMDRVARLEAAARRVTRTALRPSI